MNIEEVQKIKRDTLKTRRNLKARTSPAITVSTDGLIHCTDQVLTLCDMLLKIQKVLK